MCRKTVYLIFIILAFHLIFSDISVGADPNLVGWWKLDEGSGTVAIDSSGNGLNGVINGNPTWGTNGPFDQSNYLLFDGTDDWVDVNQFAFLLPNYTVSLYFRLGGGVTDERTMFAAVDSAEGHGILLSLNRNNPGRIRYVHRYPIQGSGVGNEDTYSPATGTLYNDGLWHHLAAVRESYTSRLLYADGVLVASNTNALGAFDKPLRVLFGAVRPGWLARWWNGGIDDVRIYNRALSPAEIGQLAGTPLASNPRPSNGEKDVSVSPVLSWRPGVNASSHNVYFGTNSDDVNNATETMHPNVTFTILSVNSYKPTALQLNTTYYWRVDEVKGATILKGAVWSFTTGNYFIVDDMESYGAANTPGPPPPAGSRIWYTWKDGEGWTEPSTVQGNGTGSVVDYVTANILHGGNQSLVFNYDNDGTNLFGHGGKKYYSEIKADTSYLAIGRDWTRAGVKALSLWFYGDSNNDASATEQMYVKLNGGKILYDGDMNDIKQASWHEWNINLSKFGIDLSNVTEIAIGFGNETNTTTPGGSGVVYFDDIRLYQPRCVLSKRTADFTKLDYAPAGYPASGDCIIDYGELDIMMNNWLTADYVVAPTTNPALAGGLVAYYPLDEGTGTTIADASGNGRNGTFEGGVTWVTPGLAGNSAINVNGGPGARVSIGTWDPIGPGGMTLSIWTRWLGQHGRSQGLISKRDGWGSSDVLRFMFEIFPNAALRLGQYGSDVYSPANTMTPYIGRWAHVAVTFDGTTARFYLNGSEIASGLFTPGTMTAATVTIGNTQSSIAWPDSPETFNGDLDEARIYNRALSPPEIAYLADLTLNDGQLHVPVQSPAEIYKAEAAGTQSINLKDFAILADNWLIEQIWP